jgi:GH25 family lysozyme M1 (1,4-beta-N-acetylmuramidase)
MAFLKVNGFHTAAAGSRTDGIGDFLRQVDAAGVPFLAYCVGGTASLIDAQNIMRRSSVPHNAIFRQDVFPHNQGGDDVPDYNKPPKQAAQEQWESHVARWPSELDPALIWGETVNELRKEVEWADWIGEFCYETGLLAVASGRKWCGPGYSAGTPDEGAWETPGMLKFLRLCAAHPDQVGVALHEYSLEPEDLWHNKGYHIGRFTQLIAACERHGIAPPTIFFTEWGWGERAIPGNRQDALDEILEVGELYAKYPSVKGAAIWALDNGWGGLADQVHGLMEPLAQLLTTTRYPDPVTTKPPAEGSTEPPYGTGNAGSGAPRVQYKRRYLVAPQDCTKEQWLRIAEAAYAGRVTMGGSYDDAGVGALADKTAVLYDLQAAQHDTFVAWYAQHYPGTKVEFASSDPAANAPTFTIPTKRADMPLVVDISKWQARAVSGGGFATDTIDWQTLRDSGNVRGAILRASVGLAVDPTYSAFAGQVDARGLARGNYHFLTNDDGAKQAALFLKHRLPGALGDWLDIEALAGKLPATAVVLDFVAAYFKATGKAIGIYTNSGSFNPLGLTRAQVLGAQLWVANYVDLDRPLSIPAAWNAKEWGVDNSAIRFWQYAAGRLPGYDRDIDLNVFHGSHEEFSHLFGEPTAPVVVTPTPPVATPKPTKPVLLGLHAGADGGDIGTLEMREFQTLAPGVIKVLSSSSEFTVRTLAVQHPKAAFIVRAFLDIGGRPVTPEQFVDWTLPDVRRSVNALAGHEVWVELHNEPNLTMEGLKAAWASGAYFNIWYLKLLGLYRRALPGGRFLFPGLSPGGDIAGIREDSFGFLTACAGAVNASDGLAVHGYFAPQSGWSMERTLDQIGPVANLFAHKALWVTEASNNQPGATPSEKAAQYVRFAKELARWPNVRGVTYFVASASNPAWGWQSGGSAETWVPVGMAALVKERGG